MDRPGLIALAEDRDLAAIAIGLRIPPAQAAQFADTHRRGIEQGEQYPVALLGLQAQHAVDLGFRQNTLGETVPHSRQAESAADVEGQVSDAVAEGQQGFEGGKDAVTAGGGQFKDRIGKCLEIGQGDGGEGLPCPAAETGDVGAVGALGVDGAAVEPNGKTLRTSASFPAATSTG